jgi:hypothetical protein
MYILALKPAAMNMVWQCKRPGSMNERIIGHGTDYSVITSSVNTIEIQ